MNAHEEVHYEDRDRQIILVITSFMTSIIVLAV
jgi:hypothetical protein